MKHRDAAVGQTISWAKSNLSVLAELSELDEFTMEEAFGSFNPEFRKPAVEKGYIEKVGERDPGDGRKSVHAVYTLSDKAYRAIEICKKQAEGPLPCGHHGFTNRGDGEYECSRNHCDAVYTREQIEEAYD